jgi:branched-chain amino acid transport system substrate-binding protein
LTEGFRGFDGVLTIAEGIKQAGKADPKAIQEGLWKVKVAGANGDISFGKEGPAGKESGQNTPSVYMIQIEDGKVAPVNF